MFSKISWLKQALGLLLFIASSSLYAGVTISVSQSGTGDIIVSANGTLKVPSTLSNYNASAPASVRGSSDPIFRLWGTSAPSNMSSFTASCGSFSAWPSASAALANSATYTQPFAYILLGNILAVPTSAAGQTIDISNKLTFTSKTLSSMGFPSTATTVNCTTGSGADADTLTIQITGLTYQSITASASQSSIITGGTSTVTVSGASGTGAVTYTSSNTAVATVNASTGVVTGVAAGSALITATKAADSTYASASSNASITVTATPPVVSAVTQTVAYNSTATAINLSATNTPTSVAVTTAASHGTATATGTSIAYTPVAGYSGTDTFQYTATNAGGTSSPATVTVTVSPPNAQAAFSVTASPTTLNAITTTSTLSTSGGSGTGAVSYAVTTGTCTVSGITVTAGAISETCTVLATKAADSSYAAATATVNITVARRATIAAAATDASVLAIHGAQIMQSQKFVTTQIDNVANHLNGYRNNFNLRPSNFGFGVNFQIPSLGPASQALYKIKDELTPKPEMQAQNKAPSKDTKSGFKKVDYEKKQDLTPYNDNMREEELAAEKIKQEQAELEKVQQYASNSHYERESLTYSIWTAGTIDYASYKTGDNKETQNKLTANGLTMGIDYKLHDAAIVGAAVGVGTAWQSAVAINTNLKAKQTAVTGYGMFGFADHWVIEGLMGYGVVDFSGTRTTSDDAAQLGINRKGETYFSSGTVSKMYWVEGYKVTPFARQDVMHINLHSYAETGAADYALGFDSTNFVHTTTSGGLQLSRDIFLEGAKLTPTAKIALNRIRTGGLAQNIYYADTGAAAGVYTLNQSGSYMTTQSLGLGLVYTTRAGDGIDIGWQGAIGANQYKLNGLRFAVRFAM